MPLNKAEASARAREKVALQSEARASFVATVGEAHEASERHKPDVGAPSQQRVRSKRIAEASEHSFCVIYHRTH